MDWESLGYSERARRVIRDRKYFLTLKCKKCKEDKEKKKAPYEFYELWAGFNIGVAYFHRAYYRKAVQEFNKIIWQVERWKKKETSDIESKENFKTFRKNHGRALLYIPAIFSRSEVQLKLQFAYHTLNTLQNRRTPSKQKKPRAQIIKAQAYLQLGRLGKSWGALEMAGNSLGCGQLGQRTEWVIPKRDELNQHFPSLGERFIDILIADHLGWLEREGEDEQKNQKDDLELRYIVKYGDTKNGKPATAKDYKKAVDDAESYLNKLANAFSTYFEVVEHHAYNRSGYFQQLARYLAWLAKASDFALSQDVKNARKKIALIAKQLYKKAKKEELLFEEDGTGKSKKGCRYCQAKGIDLRRIEPEHYTWFTKAMLDFFNSKNIFGLGEIDKDKEKFIKRLMKLEWKEREDLRINDLKLRYEYFKPKELLLELLEDDETKKKLQSSPHKKYTEWLCWRELENQAESLNLLECNRKTITKGNEQDTFGDPPIADVYTNIMQDWNESFLDHMKSRSVHNSQKSGPYFLGLRRWNSASPAKGFSVGGGYLLYHIDEKKCVDMGIAVDPGFDFVRNLFHMGFSLNDIDIVLLSHAHLDHIRDFESIVMLLSELEKRSRRQKRVHVILSLGTYKRLEHIVEDPGFRYFIEPYIIDMDREISDDYFEDEEKMPKFKFESVNSNGEHGSLNYMDRVRAVLPGDEEQANNSLQVMITPTRAYHDDKTRSDSFGFLINMTERVEEQDEEEKQSNLMFGYTGDTKWVYPKMPDPLGKGEGKDKREKRAIEDIAKQYKKCDVLLVHLGSLIKESDDGEFSFNQYGLCGTNAGDKYSCEEQVRDENHLYLVGMLRLLSSIYESLPNDKQNDMPLVLVSEFGEELRGTIRTDFIQRLQMIYKNKLAFLPVDVGVNAYLGRKGDVQGKSRGNRCACRVWCVQGNHFVNIGDADFKLYGIDHALHCVCKTCIKATPTNVLQERLRQLYEVGLELRPYERK